MYPAIARRRFNSNFYRLSEQKMFEGVAVLTAAGAEKNSLRPHDTQKSAVWSRDSRREKKNRLLAFVFWGEFISTLKGNKHAIKCSVANVTIFAGLKRVKKERFGYMA